MTLYQKIGESRIREVIERLYDAIFQDPLIGHFFFHHDKEKLIAQQMAFTSRLLGATAVAYDGRSLPQVHYPLRIRPVHFKRRQVILAETLAACGIEKKDAERWLGLEARLRGLIVSEPGECR